MPDFRDFFRIFAELDILRKVLSCFLSGYTGKNRMRIWEDLRRLRKTAARLGMNFQIHSRDHGNSGQKRIPVLRSTGSEAAGDSLKPATSL